MRAYTKERLLIVAFLFLIIASGHPWIWTFLMGARNNQRVFGFPLHYFLSLVLFSAGITLVSVAWAFLEGRVAEEISSSGDGSQAEAESEGTREADETPAAEESEGDEEAEDAKDAKEAGA